MPTTNTNDQPPVGCLGFLARLFGDGTTKNQAAEPLPYRRNDWLFTKAERSFFGVLTHVVDDDEYLIFAKVRMADLMYLPRGTEKRQSHLNRITSKHIDFVLCDRDRVQPLLAIELDDASHAKADRQRRDHFVDQACQAAGLPLIHIPARQAYNSNELRTTINNALRVPAK